MDRPSATDFLAFKWMMFAHKTLDAGDVYGGCTRKLRREIERDLGRSLRRRTEEEIVRELMEMGEDCTFSDVERVLVGSTPGRWNRFRNKWMFRKPSNQGNAYGPDLSPVEAIRQRANYGFLPLGRWFSGKRYGVVVDDEVAKALLEAEVDTSPFDIALPWSPILVKLGEQEFFMFYDGGKPVFMKFSIGPNGDAMPHGRAMPIRDSKESLAAWIACISKGESAGDNFELKVGKCLVALLPKVNARTLIVKHKISAEADVDKGSWIRKGYFRTTKDGVSWVDGALCRKELPFVHKVHEIRKKGQL